MNPNSALPLKSESPDIALLAQSGARRVLVVDDDPLMRAIASAMLQSQGWQVFHAGSADEAIALFRFCDQRNMRLSAVILDMVLPGGKDGLETLAALRQMDPAVRVIATSGFFERNAVVRCIDAGFDEVLPKPYNSQQLSDALSRLFRGSLRSS